LSNNVLFGVVFCAASSLYLFLQLKKSIDDNRKSNIQLSLANYAQVKDDPFTMFFMLLAFGIFMISLFLLGSMAYEDYNYCNILPSNITVVNSTLDNIVYSRVCFTNTNDSANMLFGLTNFWIYTTVILFGAMTFYFMFQFVRDNIYARYKKKK
jgi:hypothetical protein